MHFSSNFQYGPVCISTSDRNVTMAKKMKPSRSNVTETAPDGYRSPLSAVKGGREKIETTNSTSSLVLASFKNGAKMTIATVLFTIGILAIIYTSLAGTLMMAAPSVHGEMQKTWVARGTFPGGQIPDGTFVYGSKSTAASTDFIGRIIEGYAGTPRAFVGEAIAGPFDSIETVNGEIIADGTPTGYYGTINKQVLNEQYLIRCVEGTCKKGELLIAKTSSIAGEARGTIYPFGIKGFESTKGVNNVEPKQ